MLKKLTLAVSMALMSLSSGAAVYTETIEGHNGPMIVEVTVEHGAFESVKVVKHSETEGLGAEALKILTEDMNASKKIATDALTGASVSSKALQEAIARAMAKANGTTPDKVEFKPGTYKASVYGNNGYLNLELTVDEKGIRSIEVPGHNETAFMGAMAIEKLTQEALQFQTVNVDVISGATVTSHAFKKAAAEALAQSGADMTKWTKPVPSMVGKFRGTKDVEADLVIVGSGGAGLAAAVTAAEAGSYRIIVLEKMPVIGGNTLRCASAFNATDEKRQARLPMTETLKDAVEKALAEKPANAEHAKLIEDVRAKYTAYLTSGRTTLFDCPEWHALQTYNGGDKVGHVPLIRTYAENVYDTLEWMQAHGTPVLDRVSQGAGALWQRTHQVDAPAGTGLIQPLYDAAMAKGVKILTEMKAEELVLRDGKVVGVKATDKLGNDYRFTSDYGVILATGGYSQNKLLRQESAPHLTPDMVSTNQPGATGDGIVMARKVGADTTGMNFVQVYPLATPGTGTLQGRARKMSGLDDVIDVNKDGLRFVNEDARRDAFVAAIKKQPGGMCYDINDSTIVKEYNSFAENVETLVKIGRIVKADTIAELGEKLGMPAGNLEKTVDDYNKMVEAKNDPVFGRKLFDRKIEKGPFYATPRAPSIHHTMGGLLINSKAQVIDTEAKVIPGLYAAGEVAGGIHGSNRLGGNATADVLTFGRIAAKTALSNPLK